MDDGLRKVVLDTSALMNGCNIDFESCIPIISTIVLEELDNLKLSENGEKAFKARNAIRYIDANENKFQYIVNDNIKSKVMINSGYDTNKNDNKILDVCISENAYLSSDDKALQIKAKNLGIEIVDFNSKVDAEEYKGYKVVTLTDDEIATLYTSEIVGNKYGLLLNEYLIVKDGDGDVVERFKWCKDGLVRLKIPSIKGLKPLNDLQMCALDLMGSDVPIRILIGHAGSGKTIINARAGLHFVEKGRFQRIMYIHNPAGKGKQVGFLPGTKFDKLIEHASGLIDNLDGGELQLQQLVMQDKLQIDSPYFIKGATKENTWMMIDEAEDLDIETLKLIGTRISKNSVICLSGDLMQTEKEYKNNNGLETFINKFKGNPLVGIIKLKDDCRSEVSKLFNEL